MPFAKEADLQRTCWKCEGSVSACMPQCPYCSAFLQDPPITSKGFSSCHITFPSEVSKKAEDSDLFAVSSEDWEAVLNSQNTFEEPIQEPSPSQSTCLQHWPITALFLGFGFLAFSLIILLFSTDAGLTLSWPKNRSYIYALVGALLAYQGYRLLPDDTK
ncbi:phage holin family protein [Chlamydia sp.]|uniref:phage holin family protein n=1 Tax=Chlamydia sp. TaxID=35827 RepID=UPI0025C49069|nr:phage holin family protein [Chlamydia sp.]MBQ8498949.1 phage holin family protein [Chlamydia sp.]